MITKSSKYRKIPVEIEALLFDGRNFDEIKSFTNNTAFDYSPNRHTCMIRTLEGQHIASQGDYIIKGIIGEFYPCKPDVFKRTYERVD